MISGSEWDYTAKIKSKKAIIIEIDVDIINQERHNFKQLNEEIENYKSALAVNGQPLVDYMCRYELL